jgi:hypothetical protein
MQFGEIGFEFRPEIIILDIVNRAQKILFVFNGQTAALGPQM